MIRSQHEYGNIIAFRGPAMVFKGKVDILKPI